MQLFGIKLAIIGLGYVGLPLAVEFGRNRPVVGFDINPRRIDELKAGNDLTLETTKEELAAAKNLTYTTHPDELRSCNCYIVTVPTPIDEHKRPDLTPLIKASETVGKVLKKGDIVIYESTVYPGCTEEDCVPVLEKHSGLNFNRDFFCGYSPERINPGDKEHRVTTIKKVTSGSTPEIADLIDALYNEVITAGTHKAQSIKVAEAAKVIENTQRDLNIALINELALIFNKMGIDTEAVLKAAGSKWNFLPFRPGLVGGHCIGVDPYYLTHKAQAIGYHPEIILAGRRLNDSMGTYVVAQLVKAMTKKRIQVDGAKVLVMGLTFKENCPDLRNTRVVDIVSELKDYNCDVDVYDPWVIKNNVLGTLRTAKAAADNGVSDFVLVSTDKAVRPTNIMGASKRLAEMALQALAATQAGTRFAMVRFGNVLGSSGSVVPKFRQQIRDGGPITLTHPEVTRYFMTIPEAAQLVIQAGAMAKGGDVFVLDMGESVKIMDLARRMIELSGLSVIDAQHPDGDIAIEITGLRPGEKLYEELLIGDNPKPTSHARIMKAHEDFIPWSDLEARLSALELALNANDVSLIRMMMQQLVSGYVPNDTIVDWVYMEQEAEARAMGLAG
jgi:UDP-N-acetyl-D-galactosamine dehydrogenase